MGTSLLLQRHHITKVRPSPMALPVTQTTSARLYSQDKRKTKVVTVQSGHPDWHWETDHGYADMFDLSRCEFFLRRIRTVPYQEPSPRDFGYHENPWQSGNKQHLKIVSKTYLTKLNIGSTNVETHQADPPWVHARRVVRHTVTNCSIFSWEHAFFCNATL